MNNPQRERMVKRKKKKEECFPEISIKLGHDAATWFPSEDGISVSIVSWR